jgi:ATP-dependent exoDNAse (exonuclease V) beta subunit
MMTKPFDVLDKNQKIFGNYFIEASAGTGKTFTIAHLVLRLLLQSTPPISVKKMGIVIFVKIFVANNVQLLLLFLFLCE